MDRFLNQIVTLWFDSYVMQALVLESAAHGVIVEVKWVNDRSQYTEGDIAFFSYEEVRFKLPVAQG